MDFGVRFSKVDVKHGFVAQLIRISISSSINHNHNNSIIVIFTHNSTDSIFIHGTIIAFAYGLL